MSHQSSTAFFFGFSSGAWPFCLGSVWSNPGPGPFLCSTRGCAFAHWPEEEEPLSSDVATTMARSVKITADRRKVRSMVAVRSAVRSRAALHPETSNNPLPTCTLTRSLYGMFQQLPTTETRARRHAPGPRPQAEVKPTETSGVHHRELQRAR